jgi:hypothetical protein
MNGPYAPGTHDNPIPPTKWDWEKTRLIRGKRYRVIKAFLDADGDRHEVGEAWTFVTSMFSRFDDELTICVRQESDDEWRIRMFWKPEAQQEVIEDFLNYVALISSETSAGGSTKT